MKTTKILYWLFNGLFAAFMLFSGIQNMLVTADSVELIHTKLGYPIYFIGFIGVAKTLGAVGLLIPGFPRLKEWIYAGFAFDLIVATYSIIAIGENSWYGMLIFIVFWVVAYIYHHKKLKID